MAASTPEPSPEVHSNLKNIAVVDDDPAARVGVGALLKALGYVPEVFDSVHALVRAHAIRRVQCIILDVAMPQIDGSDAQKGLRLTNYTGPIIFCSAYSEAEVRDRVVMDDHAYYLGKPVNRERLLEALKCASETLRTRKSPASYPRRPTPDSTI